MPLSLVSAGGTKGASYAHASYRTAAIRKAAIIGAQKSKSPQFDPNQKPFIKEQHLAGGFATGVLDAVLRVNCKGFM
jgi:hypothetical protein